MLKQIIIILTSVFVSASINPDRYPLSISREARPIINVFNFERGNFDLPKIIFDYQMAFESKTDVIFNSSYVGCANKTQIEPFIKKVRRQQGWRYLFSYRGSLRRLVDKDLEEYDAFQCSKEKFDNYLSCYSECKNGIYPRLIERTLINIASVRKGKIIHLLGRMREIKVDSPYI